MSRVWPPKDPDAVADYQVNWDLAGDTIQSGEFTLLVDGGLVKDDEDHGSTTSTIWLSGGTAGAVATIRCRIVTNGGRTFDEEILLLVDSGLVVETGAGLATAQSYASVADAIAYCALHGLTFQGTKAELEADLRTGFDWLNRKSWKGVRRRLRDQSGAWPRVDASDGEGLFIQPDEIPVEIIHANIELAVWARANPGKLNPTVIPQDKVRRKKIGPLEKEFFPTPSTPDAAKPTLTRVDSLISGFLSSGGGVSLVGTSGRSS